MLLGHKCWCFTEVQKSWVKAVVRKGDQLSDRTGCDNKFLLNEVIYSHQWGSQERWCCRIGPPRFLQCQSDIVIHASSWLLQGQMSFKMDVGGMKENVEWYLSWNAHYQEHIIVGQLLQCWNNWKCWKIVPVDSRQVDPQYIGMNSSEKVQQVWAILFVDNGMATSCFKVQQMALVNNLCNILPQKFLSKSDRSAVCRILSESRSTKRIDKTALALSFILGQCGVCKVNVWCLWCPLKIFMGML